VGSGREVHGKENPRKPYAVGLRTEPALLVRGSSRRITIMRLRPANIRVINRRNSRLDRHLRCLLRKGRKKKENEEAKKRKRYLTRSFHIRATIGSTGRLQHRSPCQQALAALAFPGLRLTDVNER